MTSFTNEPYFIKVLLHFLPTKKEWICIFLVRIVFAKKSKWRDRIYYPEHLHMNACFFTF